MNSFQVKATILGILSFFALIFAYCSFKMVVTDPGHETVLFDKPYFFGHGGIQKETLKPGRNFIWSSTEPMAVQMSPQRVDERFDDLMTSDTTPVDFHTTLQLQITDAVAFKTRFPNGMYDNNIQRQYQAMMRDEARKYTMTELLTGTGTATLMEKNILKQLDALIKSKNLPVLIPDISTGRAVPNKEVLSQIDQTAAQQQRAKTMIESEKAEVQRKKAEQARADADNAYREKMDLTPDQFLQLESIKRYSDACKSSQCNLVFGAAGNTTLQLPTAKK